MFKLPKCLLKTLARKTTGKGKGVINKYPYDFLYISNMQFILPKY